MFEFIKSKINEKKILRNQLELIGGLNKRLLEANKNQQEDINKLKEDIKVWEQIDKDYIIKLNELECDLNEKSNYMEELEKKLKEAKENNQSKDYTINNLRNELELEQYERGRVSEKLVKSEKKLTRATNKILKLNIELLQTKNINKELISKVTVSSIAKHQLKELCKYNDNNNKEPDKVKRPGVLVHKQVSGVKVYELANLM